jgi:hypothetical protein
MLSMVRRSGGCSGGVAIYFGAKAAAELGNLGRTRQKLSAATKAKLKRLFPKLDLGRVRIRTGCSLPGNWFQPAGQVLAMTFGYTIYFKAKTVQSTMSGLNVLMHELVHVDQVRRRGNDETRFACDYGKGFLKAGSYAKNPLEVEAYDFVAANALKG